MTYKILNYLFKWDYIAWKNTAASGVARVKTDGLCRAWYFRYKSTGLVDIINTPDQVVWLTCEPSKYMIEYYSKEEK